MAESRPLVAGFLFLYVPIIYTPCLYRLLCLYFQKSSNWWPGELGAVGFRP